jgi:transposase-like protein
VRGVPPAKVARDLEVAEPLLYAWRDRFVRGGVSALEQGDTVADP